MQTDSFQCLLGKSLAFAAIHLCEAQRQLNVFQQGHAGHQIERTKYQRSWRHKFSVRMATEPFKLNSPWQASIG
jgi:hypothetical protein